VLSHYRTTCQIIIESQFGSYIYYFNSI